MSAKSGDQVRQAFWKIAATLAGVTLMKPDLEIQSTVVPATIIDHARHDEAVSGGKVPNYTKKERGCILS